MTAHEIICKLHEKSGMNTADFGRSIGYKHMSKMHRILHEENKLSVNTFLDILDACGYEVVVRPKGKVRTKYRLTKESEDNG